MKERFPEEQIIGFLREAEINVPVKDLCRRRGFREASADERGVRLGLIKPSKCNQSTFIEGFNGPLREKCLN